MITYTFIFIEPGHVSKAIVTAETRVDCEEKYFLKYPKRKNSPNLKIYEGDHGDDLDFELEPINP